jgi:hypothetical protein
MAEGTCTSCGRPILTLMTEGGTIRHLNPDPVDHGNHIIVKVGGTVRARVLTGNHPPAPAGTGHRVHQCPPPAPRGPACSACLEPMDRDRAHAEKWATHPTCDPDYQQNLIDQNLPGVLHPRAARRPRR